MYPMVTQKSCQMGCSVDIIPPRLAEILALDRGTGSDIIDEIKMPPILSKAIKWLMKYTVFQN